MRPEAMVRQVAVGRRRSVQRINRWQLAQPRRVVAEALGSGGSTVAPARARSDVAARMASLIEAHWLIPTVFATSCWALSDVCCDCAIAGGGDDESAAAPPQPVEKKPARGDAGPDAAAGPVASKSSSSPSKGDRPERWGAQLTDA